MQQCCPVQHRRRAPYLFLTPRHRYSLELTSNLIPSLSSDRGPSRDVFDHHLPWRSHTSKPPRPRYLTRRSSSCVCSALAQRSYVHGQCSDTSVTNPQVQAATMWEMMAIRKRSICESCAFEIRKNCSAYMDMQTTIPTNTSRWHSPPSLRSSSRWWRFGQQ